MRNIVIRLSLFCAWLAACGPVVPAFDTKGINNSQDLAKATAKVNDAIARSAIGAARADVSGTVTFTKDCLKGGTKTGTVKGKLSGSTRAADDSIVATYELELSSCKTDDYELYGVVTWSYSASSLGSGSARYVIKLSGTLGVKLDGGAIQGNINYKDLTVTADISQTGTTINYEITVTGGVDVGGKPFALTKDDFMGVFSITK